MARITFAVILALCFAASNAFMNGAARSMVRANSVSMKMDLSKTAASIAPALLSAPAFASTDLISSTMSTSLEVTGPAYLAVLLGTFVPVTFLIVLYTQSEARRAGARGE
mmetsp:Transcript_3741/g.3874  ORF Transcript_3741/g.3874 Transcript_3741/m.3874 type:complete len:110 (+) Transcript_3741:58-387(+)|eukprot:CAMPEP_0182427274 /NCGR_PEP_ID=MMETSP1167-20130531/16636_1 /TAXON_ID=2988 /ORGANISM="Mallomonas Sp, Strain CCMP3275" /LENGTH=109 /DNA_ID=CAMNT_0024609399 /DNA_START=56 /DNA_END=385 /DNA_ORIENTATION=+